MPSIRRLGTALRSKFALSLAMALAVAIWGGAAVAQSEWSVVHDAPGGRDSINMATIQVYSDARNQFVVDAWYRFDPPAPQSGRNGITYDHFVSKERYYCQTRQTRAFDEVGYVGGQSVYRFEDSGDVSNVIPESVGEAKLEFACSIACGMYQTQSQTIDEFARRPDAARILAGCSHF